MISRPQLHSVKCVGECGRESKPSANAVEWDYERDREFKRFARGIPSFVLIELLASAPFNFS